MSLNFITSLKLLNNFLKESCFPDCWKVSVVVLVFKNFEEKSTAGNYHTVTLLSVLGSQPPGNKWIQWIIRQFENGVFFTEKSGNFGWISGKLGKINIFLEKHFSDVNFRLALFSVMHIFMFWNIWLLFLAMSIMLQPGFFCLKIYEYSSVTYLIVVWCFISTSISVLLKWLSHTGIKS